MTETQNEPQAQPTPPQKSWIRRHRLVTAVLAILAYFSHLTNEIERRKNHRHGKPSRITFIQDSNNPQNKAMA